MFSSLDEVTDNVEIKYLAQLASQATVAQLASQATVEQIGQSSTIDTIIQPSYSGTIIQPNNSWTISKPLASLGKPSQEKSCLLLDISKMVSPKSIDPVHLYSLYS